MWAYSREYESLGSSSIAPPAVFRVLHEGNGELIHSSREQAYGADGYDVSVLADFRGASEAAVQQLESAPEYALHSMSILSAGIMISSVWSLVTHSISEHECGTVEELFVLWVSLGVV